MALVSCPDCGREVSERAPACPHCGAPMQEAATAVPKAEPERVRTTEDSALTRSRGCGDIVLALLIVPVLLALLWLASR